MTATGAIEGGFTGCGLAIAGLAATGLPGAPCDITGRTGGNGFANGTPPAAKFRGAPPRPTA